MSFSDVFNQLRPTESYTLADSMGKAATLKSLAMQTEGMAQNNAMKKQEHDQAQFQRKLSVVGGAMDQLAGMPEEERAAAYPRVRQQLIQQGMINPNESPEMYDPGWFRTEAATVLPAYRNSDEYLARQNKQAQLGKTKAETAKLWAEAKGKGAPQNKFIGAVEQQSAKQFAEMQKAGADAQGTIDLMDDAMQSLVDYSKNSVGGTGPLASLGGVKTVFSSDAENLDRKFKEISLQKMKTMFAGMAKAIDSDAERRFFMASQPNITNRESTNATIILGAKSLALKTKAEAEAQQQWVAQRGSLDGYQSPIKGRMVTVVSQSGEMQLIPKEAMKQAQQAGLMPLDRYAKTLFQAKDGGHRGRRFANGVAGPADAQAGEESRPQTIRQNGHTYTLNPETGQYE